MSSAITAVVVKDQLSKKAAKKQQQAADAAQGQALDAQDKASKRAEAEQRRQFNLTRADTATQRKVGDKALNYLSGALTPGGEFSPQTFEVGDFTTDPGYDFRLQQGAQARANALGSGGMKLSGRAQKELERYGQDYGSNEYANVYGRRFGEFNQNEANKQNYLARQMQLAGYGSQGINTSSGAGATAANNLSANYLNTGANIANIATQHGADTANIQGQRYANMNNAIQGGIKNYLSYDQQQKQKALFNDDYGDLGW